MLKQTVKSIIQLPKKFPKYILNVSPAFQFQKTQFLSNKQVFNFSNKNNNNNDDNGNEDVDKLEQNGFSKFKRRKSKNQNSINSFNQKNDENSEIKDKNTNIQDNNDTNQEDKNSINNNNKNKDNQEEQPDQSYFEKRFPEFTKNQTENENKEKLKNSDKSQNDNSNNNNQGFFNKSDSNNKKIEEEEENFDDYKPQGFDKFKRRKSNPKLKVKQHVKIIKNTQENDIKAPEVDKSQENQEFFKDDLLKDKKEKQIQEDQENFDKLTPEQQEQAKKEQEYRDKSEKIQDRSTKFDLNEGYEKIKKDKEKKSKYEEPSFFSKKSDKQNNENNDNKKDNQNNFQMNMTGKPQKPSLGWRGAFLIGLGGTLFLAKLREEHQASEQQISYAEFFKFYLERGNVMRISIVRQPNKSSNGQKTIANIFTHGGEQRRLVVNHLEHFLEEVERIQESQGKLEKQYVPLDFQYNVTNSKKAEKFFTLLMTGATLTITYMMFKNIKLQMNQFKNGMGGGGGAGGDIFGGGSKVKVYGLDTKIDVKFADVAGQDEQKQEIMEFVDFLKNPKKYSDLGAKLPKGALLSGPPGTGKTMLAKACAGEAGVPFLFMSGSDFVEMYVGVGSQRVRDLFKQAKQKSPSIIFIDEIDAVGKKRNTSGKGGNDERENTLNQLLVEMDGFGTDQNVVVLAATNRADMLDPALKRPGRFDRSIEVTLPDIDGRKQIFKVHLKDITLDFSYHDLEGYANRLATLTPGFSGAEIANLCNEAALLAARKNKPSVQSIDFEMASERVTAGLEKKTMMTREEKRVVSVHEAGHAVVGWFLEGGHPLIKVTIIPRSKGSLGYAQYLPNEGSLDTKEEMLDRVCGILGGRIAEQIFFGRITTGAANDLEQCYKMVFNMVAKLGMSERVGYLGFKDAQSSKQYSNYTNTVIDEEVNRIIKEQTNRCIDVIEQYKDKVENLSEELLNKETLDLRQITAILGDRPFAAKSNFKEYLETSEDMFNELDSQKIQEKEQLQKQKEEEDEKQNLNNDQQQQEDIIQQEIKQNQNIKNTNDGDNNNSKKEGEEQKQQQQEQIKNINNDNDNSTENSNNINDKQQQQLQQNEQNQQSNIEQKDQINPNDSSSSIEQNQQQQKNDKNTENNNQNIKKDD